MGIVKASEIGELEVLKTNTFLDELSGVWGLPKERIVEFYGSEKTGKSTASFHVIAAAQQEELPCLLVDVEHSFVGKYAEDLGIDLRKLDILRAAYAEEIIDKTEEAIKSGKYDGGVIVFDSIGSLSSRVEDEKSAGEKTIGIQASLMGRFVRKLAPQVSYRKILFIGINHSRTDIITGKVTTMGGKAWSEKKKLSLEFREKSGVLLKSGDNVVGKKIIVRVMKNAVGATERKEIEVSLIFGQGFSVSANLLDEAITKGVITKEGNTYYFSGEKLGTIGKVRTWAQENAEKLKEALNEKT